MPNGQDHNPLDQSDLEKLNQVIQMAAETGRLIAKVARSEIPTEQAEQENTDQLRMASALKREFFPNAT